MRLVLDTNQHISAIIQPNGNPAHILRIWRLGIIELAISPPILDEFKIVVHRPRIQQKYNLSDEDIAEYLEVLNKYALIVPGTTIINAVPDDPDDNIIITCAIEAAADMIISGDQHLLTIGSYQNIPIVKASDFLTNYFT